MTRAIYKIFTQSEWVIFSNSGYYDGSEDDKRDGYIHLSAANQLQGSLDKHFAPHDCVIVAKIDQQAIDASALKWETSRGGQDFPHYYASFTLRAIEELWTVEKLDQTDNNNSRQFQIPADILADHA